MQSKNHYVVAKDPERLYSATTKREPIKMSSRESVAATLNCFIAPFFFFPFRNILGLTLPLKINPALLVGALLFYESFNKSPFASSVSLDLPFPSDNDEIYWLISPTRISSLIFAKRASFKDPLANAAPESNL